MLEECLRPPDGKKPHGADSESCSVQILLSTYNGEKYLREQLDSFVSQRGFCFGANANANANANADADANANANANAGSCVSVGGAGSAESNGGDAGGINSGNANGNLGGMDGGGSGRAGRLAVLVRDDGSTDGTIGILREYAERYGFNIVLGDNVGTTRSYFELFALRDRACGYYALSDQDDVWLDSKIGAAVEALRAADGSGSNSGGNNSGSYSSGSNSGGNNSGSNSCGNDSVPALFASRSAITDEGLARIGMSEAFPKGASFYNAMAQNIAPGHTQVLNRKLMDIVADSLSDDIVVLDWWIYIIASAVGKVVLSDQPLALHRQHGGNQVGYRTNPLVQSIARLRRVIKNGGGAMARQLLAFQELGIDMPREYSRELDMFLGALPSLPSRVKYAAASRCYRQTGTPLFKLLYVLGNYRI
jgi:hypothetical protein